MSAPRPWFIAATALALATGCSSMQDTYPSVPPSNATVARVLMQAQSVAPLPAPAAAAPNVPATVAATPVADVDKADKRGRKVVAQKAKPAAHPAAPSTATAAAERPRTPAGAAPVYRYLVELDRGGSRSFDFEADQKLRAGDRVFVTDSGALNVH
jgi:hypothetical protein